MKDTDMSEKLVLKNVSSSAVGSKVLICTFIEVVKVNEMHPNEKLEIIQNVNPVVDRTGLVFLPLAVLAGVARLTGCALIASISKALTGGREPVQEKKTVNIRRI